MKNITCNGFEINRDSHSFDFLKNSNEIITDEISLKERVAKDGYLFFKGFFDREDVLDARREMLLKYAIIGEIDNINHDVMEGVLKEKSFVSSVNLDAFVESVRTGRCYENLVMNKRLLSLFERFLGGAVQAFDYRWPRMMRVGEGCGIHADVPYVGRGTKNVWTSWIPIGDVPLSNGPLIVLEGSHRNPKLEEYFAKDAANERLRWLETDPVKLQRDIGGRWLSADFEAGDLLCISGFLVHGALDNNSTKRQCRLSSDTRYQLKDDLRDSRWFGDVSNPYGNDYECERRVFYPGLIQTAGMNADLKEEWKPVDEEGKLKLD